MGPPMKPAAFAVGIRLFFRRQRQIFRREASFFRRHLLFFRRQQAKIRLSHHSSQNLSYSKQKAATPSNGSCCSQNFIKV